jgi:hypothetical protein
MNSSKMMESQVLAAKPDIKASVSHTFLEELANMSDGAKSIARFERRFGHIFRSEIPLQAIRAWASYIEERHPDELIEAEIIHNYWLLPLRGAVRTVWLLPDLRRKRLAVYAIVTQLVSPGDPQFSFGPVHSYSDFFNETLRLSSGMIQILDQLVDERSYFLARKCLNPECPSPFFFARRRKQKYCSEVCAMPAQRDSKRRWWREHGNQWRSKAKIKARERQMTKRRNKKTSSPPS